MALAQVEIEKQLAGIIGPEHVTRDTGMLRKCGWEGTASPVMVSPSDGEQVCEVLRLAHQEQWAVLPAGGGTKQRMGGTPQRADLLLSLRRLNRIADYQPADLTVTAEAGLPIRELDVALRAQGQMLPFDAPFAEQATVGGVLSTDGSGPRRLGFGTCRDFVIGIRFVTAEGRPAKSGGKVVKNVAGYDMAKMLIGSHGTLGVITEATFKVFPIPPATATLVIGFRSAGNALRARHRLLHSPFAIQALDLADTEAGKIMPEETLTAPFNLLVAAGGPDAVVGRFLREVPSLLREDAPEGFLHVEGESESALWRRVREMTPQALRNHPGTVVVKASLLLSRMGEFMEQARQIRAATGFPLALLARAGSGVVYSYLWPASSGESSSTERLAGACQSLLAEAERLEGRGVVEWSPEDVKQRINIWGTLRDDFALMQRLKAHFDPHNILNPGRFYGGI